MIDIASRVRRNPSVVKRELAAGEGAVLLHMESGQYHGVNPIGLAIWELLDEDRTVAEVIATLRNRVEDPPAHLQADVLEFLQGVHERDLITVV